MKLNSVENFIAGNRQQYLFGAQKSEDIEIITPRKEKPDFDITREIANRTFIRPLPPKGHIVKNNILSAPRDFVDDIVTDVKSLKSAWKGDANDHQLGRLNDLGMKFGGLAIAAYLFSKRPTPITRAMEFVGLGSFFASMALWPKIALDIPARIIHGFSPFMKYEDSQGRKKGFFSDNQFIPFDMLSDKEVNKVGDRLRVPTNQPNRREAIEEKMRQIALQNHTMWMLTAGFATPIMSSLICNFAEPYIDDMYSSYMNKKIDRIMAKFPDECKKFKTNEVVKRVNDIMALNTGKPINKELMADIAKTLTANLGPKVGLGIQKDLEQMFVSDKFIISETSINQIATRVNSLLMGAGTKLPKETIKMLSPTETQLMELFTQNGYFNTALTDLEIKNIVGDISELVIKNVNELQNSRSEITIEPHVLRRLSSALKKVSNESNVYTLENILKVRPSNLLDANAQSKIQDIAKIISELSAEHTALNVYAYKKLAYAPSTAKAKYWNDSVKSIIKTLNITPDEIAATRYDRKLIGELLNRKVWGIATSDSVEYKNFVSRLAHTISQINIHVNPTDLNGRFINQAKTTYKNAADTMRQLGFNHAADRLIRVDGKEAGTLFGITKLFVQGNLTNLSSTFSALLNKVNVFRTIYKDPSLKFINAENLPKEVKEEMLALVEYLTTEGRISDYSVKFDFLRNLTPSQEVGNLNITKYDGVKYAYYDLEKLVANDGVIIKSDVNFFRRVMNMMFNTPINAETTSALAEYSHVGDMLREYRKNMISAVANLENFMYPAHVMDVVRNGGNIDKGRTYTSTTPRFRANTVGASLDDVFFNSIKQSYNTRRWLKMFGGFGAGLLGFTVLTQFLFGHGGAKSRRKANA